MLIEAGLVDPVKWTIAVAHARRAVAHPDWALVYVQGASHGLPKALAGACAEVR